MATSTDPTVPIPTTTDIDDDDDDDVTSMAPAPHLPPTPTPNIPTSSLLSLTSVPTPTSTNASVSSSPTAASGNGGLSVGASVGIGIGAALGVILLLLAGWFCVRRNRSGLRRLSKGSAASDTAHDLEKPGEGMGPEIREHRALGPVEMDTSERGLSELASPVIPVEAAGDRGFAVELQGSKVPPKRSRERLFLDSPIDEEQGRFEKDVGPVDEKRSPL
ncbi:hypothetical protein G6011_02753 [Alternaria panax]|uniref:Mid2 domain-containing protein n=1 Tax=Alternaria panax TaxID=48097 RepID=A0AAD4FAH4_9PLEO|nr:hypothetical protein G6011_02753 [Alternaria panax]